MQYILKSISIIPVLATLGSVGFTQESQPVKKHELRPTSTDGKALERAQQLHRDSARLDKVHKIAVVPVIVQVRFDKDKRIPDPPRVLASVQAGAELPGILSASHISGKYNFQFGPDVSNALTDLKLQVCDLFITRSSGTWESPAETVVGGKQDEAQLLSKRDDMKRSRNEMTLFRMKWHDNPETAIGLASFDQWVLPSINSDKAKQLAQKLGVDALFFPVIYDIEVYEGQTGFSVFTKRFKSTRTHVYGALMATEDSQILWQARARGVKSHQANYFYVGRMKGELSPSVLEGTADAMQILLSDLIDGTGVPTKK